MRKKNFRRICYKNCRVAFRLVLQFTANLFGSRKKSKYSFPQAPGFCADGDFILAMYFGADYIHLSDKISLHRTYWLVFIGGDIDCFLPSKISVANKNTIGALQTSGTYWNESLRFFLLPKTFAVSYRTRQNATRQLLQQIH